MDTTAYSLDTSAVEDEEPRLGYTYQHIKTMLSNSSIKDWFPFVQETSDARELLHRFVKVVSKKSTLKLVQALDLFTLSIMMMNYQKDNLLLMEERFILVDTVCYRAESLDSEEIYFIALGLYEKFVDGLGEERLEKVLDIHTAIPALVKSSRVGNDISVALLLIIMEKYTGKPVNAVVTGNAQKAFEMAKTVNWKQLAESGRHADMFMVIRTFSLIINCRRTRDECPDWKANLGAEIHKYFLQVRKSFDHSSIYGAFEMMIERFLAYCVIRGASTNPQITNFKISEERN
ncbi:uncharacterized protein [Drosophila bipectinata]|uniref:uncharacterized protein n=1 Tax=Drosophila bipectinata TaxID=42026 RepID=UPI001C8A70FC|nr:uncharacterized protein LOC108127483 [Drosophila bipectinata]